MIAECYSTDIYCDGMTEATKIAHNFPRLYGNRYFWTAQFTAPNKRDSHRQVRAAGWKFVGARHLCPGCVADLKHPTVGNNT